MKTMVPLLRKTYDEVRRENHLWPVWQWPRYEAKRIQWPQYGSRQ